MKLFLPLTLALNGFRSSSALGDLSQLGQAIELDTASANRQAQLPLGDAVRTLKEKEVRIIRRHCMLVRTTNENNLSQRIVCLCCSR